jgi:hypothetical protein
MRYGMGAALHLRAGRLHAIEIIPLLTQNRIVKYRPRVPSGKRLDRFFDGLIGRSATLGAVIERRGAHGWFFPAAARRRSGNAVESSPEPP